MSRARVSQIMSLLQLPDEIQEYVMVLAPWEQCIYSGRRLRVIAGICHEAAQSTAFEDLVKKLSGSAEA